MLRIKLEKWLSKKKYIFSYLFFEASLIIQSINEKKFIPWYNAIYGTNERFVIPVPLLNKNEYFFSFSGIKSFLHRLVDYLIYKNIQVKLNVLYDLCSSLRKTLINIILERAISICFKLNIKILVLGGGSSSNELLKLFSHIMKKYYSVSVHCLF